ncbi:MAG TPA: MBL fold metallo-hydrolase [Bacteroidota bacterium]
MKIPGVLLVAILSLTTCLAQQTSVVLLGTGNPYPSPTAQGPATAIVVSDRYFLVDAGTGVMRQINAAKLSIKGPTAAFITHLHSDHTLGYPDLIFTTWIMQRHHPFPVYGPSGLQKMTDHFIAAYEQDIPIRTFGLERETPEGYQVNVHEISPGIVYDSSGVRVTAILVPHGNWKEAYAYRFDTPGRSIVISGDMKPSEEFVNSTRGVDVLVSEVYPEVRLAPENRPGGEHWPQYMREFHTSDVELGQMAARIEPKLLVLHHIVWMGGTEKELLEGIRKGGFNGKVVVGKDLERY